MEIKRFLIRCIRKTIAQLLSDQEKKNQYYMKKYEKNSIKVKTILYEVRDGQTIVDSPFALYEKISKDERFDHFYHIWVIDNLDNPAFNTIDQQRANVEIVVRNSKKYFYWLATAKYLINSSTFPSFFVKKEGQIYVNTWHGTPLKSMGYRISDDLSVSQNVVRNFLMTDFLLASNSIMTNMYLEDYKLKNLYSGEILEAGSPRIDWTINYPKEAVYQDLRSLGLKFDEKLASILYCPTWKGKQITKTSDDMEQIIQESLLLKEKFSGDYNFFLKVHPFIYNKISIDKRVSSFLIPDSYDANKCLADIDILITDYSSIFFDYLVTNKPIIFYVWDSDIYEQERGLSLKVDELPGPVVYTTDELIISVETINLVKQKFKAKYEKLRQKTVCYEDGFSSERYIDYIFFNQESKNLNVISPKTEKKKLLFFPGRMKNNGITSSFLNLVNNIDHTNFDVSVIIANPLTKEEQKNMKLIPDECRLIFRPGKHAFTFRETITDYYFESFGVKPLFRKFYPMNAYKREMRRLLGISFFDAAIDFSGYSYFWGKFIAAVPSKKKLVFQHNDLLSDSLRNVGGKQPHRTNLKSLFTIYFLFDRILSVSEETKIINQRKLAKYIDPNQVGVVRNSLNINQIINYDQKKQKQNQLNIILREKNTVSVKLEGFFKVYSQVSNISHEKYREIYLSKADRIKSVAIYKYQNETYFKILVNNIYQGWIDSKFVKKSMIKNIKYNKVKLIGTINAASEPVFYSEIETKKIEKAFSINKTYIYLSQKAVLQEDAYYLAENGKGELGWIKSSDVTNIHDIKYFSFLKWLFLLKNKHDENSGSSKALSSELDGKVVTIDPKFNNFVTMGRLSPEKNQATLIRAFSKVLKSFPNSRLYLLGEGPLKSELDFLIKKIGLSDNILLLGHRENPFKIIKQCDLFVLPSYYEGQPMVLLECLTLGTTVLASDIPANQSVLKDKFGFYIKGTSESEIASSLINQISKGFPLAPQKFDAVAYNYEVLKDFYNNIK